MAVARSSSSIVRQHYPVVIGGGGIMGCSSAYFLTRSFPPSQICIVERDPLYKKAATVLSVGSIRQQFSLPGNILLSLKSSNFLKNHLQEELKIKGEDTPNIQYIDGGYLLLAATKEGERILEDNYEIQRSLGATTKLLSPVKLKETFPWLNVDDIKLGSLGVKNEGWFDPWLLLNAFRRKLQSLGVCFIHGQVNGLNVSSSNEITRVQVTTKDDKLEVDCNYFVNAGGPFAAKIAEMAGIGDPKHSNPIMRTPLPVKLRKRQVFVFHCPHFTGSDHYSPLIVDPAGFYFRSEPQEGMFIAGMPPFNDTDTHEDDLEVDYTQFEETIWPLLAHRVPAFENLKLKGAWAGFYDYNTFDQNGIIGPHPIIHNFIFVNGFSGHGIQQSPAVGQLVSEYIKENVPQVEFENFKFERIIRGEKYLEKNVI